MVGDATERIKVRRINVRNGFNFQTIKPTSGGSSLDDNRIRLTATTIPLGDNVLPTARKGDKVGVRVDVENQAIYLFKDDVGYTVQQADDSSNRYITPGKRLREAGLSIGDYVRSDEQPEVFVRAMGKTE